MSYEAGVPDGSRTQRWRGSLLNLESIPYFPFRGQLPILEAAKLRAAGVPFRKSLQTIFLTVFVDDAFFAITFLLYVFLFIILA